MTLPWLLTKPLLLLTTPLMLLLMLPTPLLTLLQKFPPSKLAGRENGKGVAIRPRPFCLFWNDQRQQAGRWQKALSCL